MTKLKPKTAALTIDPIDAMLMGCINAEPKQAEPKATVVHIGGEGNAFGTVISVDGDVWTVELSDGRVIRRHRKNFQ